MYKTLIARIRKAFTFAEVLITLTIIGIIAAIVVPAIMSYYEKQTYVSLLKKDFSTLNEGFKMIMTNAGCTGDIVCANVIGSDKNTTTTNIVNTGVFDIIKKCDEHQAGCHDKPVYFLNNVSTWSHESDWYSLIVMKDGWTWGVNVLSNQCNYPTGTGSLSNVCFVYALLDVNGEKPPNIAGKDIFWFYLLADGTVVPVGMSNDSQLGNWRTGAHSCNASGDGIACFARIMEEGWQMNY